MLEGYRIRKQACLMQNLYSLNPMVWALQAVIAIGGRIIES